MLWAENFRKPIFARDEGTKLKFCCRNNFTGGTLVFEALCIDIETMQYEQNILFCCLENK